MEKEIKLVTVLAQESKHIVSSCWGKQRCIFVERNHVGIGAVEKNMLLILDIISKSKSESLSLMHAGDFQLPV